MFYNSISRLFAVLCFFSFYPIQESFLLWIKSISVYNFYFLRLKRQIEAFLTILEKSSTQSKSLSNQVGIDGMVFAGDRHQHHQDWEYFLRFLSE